MVITPIDSKDRSALRPIDVGPRVRACVECQSTISVPKYVSTYTSTRLHREDNEDAP